jgi:hypothetical protein
MEEKNFLFFRGIQMLRLKSLDESVMGWTRPPFDPASMNAPA